MDKITEIRDALNARKGTWPKVCEDTKIDYSWLSKFAQGRIPKPGYQFVATLDKYLSETQGQ